MRIYPIDLDWIDYYAEGERQGLQAINGLRCRSGIAGFMHSFGTGDWCDLYHLAVL